MPASRRIGALICGLFLGLFQFGLQSGAADPWDDAPSMPLCDALAASSLGDVTPVVLRGVVDLGPEMVIFHDPAQRRCPLDVQPSTLIDIPAGDPDREALLEFLEEHGRATVTARGVLHGPPPIGEDDLALPTIVAYANRMAHRRYGHRGAFRTKFVVETVLDVSPAPDGDASAILIDPPPPEDGSLPRIEALSLPRYPERARKAGLTGDVRVAVRIENGNVAAARVMEGDRLFHTDTIESAQTWVFADGLNAEIDVTFSYRLELRPSDSDGGVRVDISLPSRITIVAPRYAW